MTTQYYDNNNNNNKCEREEKKPLLPAVVPYGGPNRVLYADPPKFYAFAGLIGAGKTTMADGFGRVTGCRVYHELGPDADSIAAFYKDKSKHAFRLQVELGLKRYRHHKLILWDDTDAVMDRSIYEDLAFARMLRDGEFMTELEYRTYLQLAYTLHSDMRKPTAIIWLDVTPAVALERIRARGRVMEVRGIDIEYLSALYDTYQIMLAELCKTVPILRVQYSEGFLLAEDVIPAVQQALNKLGTVTNLRITIDATSNKK